MYKKKMQIFKQLLSIILIVSVFSCAREINESARSIEERILKARMQVQYLDTLHKTESGLYYMIQAKGVGKPVEKEGCIYVRFSDFDFNENYVINTDGTPSSTEEHVAKQLGLFSFANYYGPDLWYSGVNALAEGIDEMVLSMREGDKRRIWLPSWLSTFGYTGSQQLYSFTTVHDVEVLRVIDNIEKFQIDSLESYRDRYYPGVDSLSYGFYKKTLTNGTGDTLTVGNRVKVWYVGRLLDNFIFDLNVADTAKKYYIYDSSKSYLAMEGECKEDEVFGIVDNDGNSGSTVSGFSKAIFNMKHQEEAVVFFYSDLGYGAGDGKSRLFRFAPLVFWLKVERTDWNEESEN
ncbi:MAG: hypothetical protein LBC84_01480 [Prevotellaceae bacterium]|jgi:FKBP-type peptidyl-prolyl cis-trans isomerase|nr:hypothetical protein [Prevotellaceae bacterium]